MITPIKTLIDGYQKWLEHLDRSGWPIWFGTLHFTHQRHLKTATINIMQQEAERIYKGLLTNIFRDPGKMALDKLPLFIGCPDAPVSHHKPTVRQAELLPNNGMHYQFLLAVPPVNRLREPLDVVVRQKLHIFVGNHGNISYFDLRHFPLIQGANVADYLFKHIKRRTYTTDDILILPRESAAKSKPSTSKIEPTSDDLTRHDRHSTR